MGPTQVPVAIDAHLRAGPPPDTRNLAERVVGKPPPREDWLGAILIAPVMILAPFVLLALLLADALTPSGRRRFFSGLLWRAIGAGESVGAGAALLTSILS
jgi:hypothetical protein